MKNMKKYKGNLKKIWRNMKKIWRNMKETWRKNSGPSSGRGVTRTLLRFREGKLGIILSPKASLERKISEFFKVPKPLQRRLRKNEETWWNMKEYIVGVMAIPRNPQNWDFWVMSYFYVREHTASDEKELLAYSQ